MPHNVDQVKDFDEEISTDQIVTVPDGPESVEPLRTAAVPVELDEEASEIFGDVLHRLLDAVVIRLVLAFDSSVRDVTDRYTRLLAEQSPDGARQVEDEGLTGEKERNPLIITYDVFVGIMLRWEVCTRQRNPMSICRPTYFLCVFHLTSGKMRWTVTADWFIDEYSRCRQNSDDTHQIDGVFATQLIGETVSSTKFCLMNVTEYQQ